MDRPLVQPLPPGEALPEPLPQVEAFVIDPGDRVVVLGTLSPDQVRALFRELAERRMATTGNDYSALVSVAVVALVTGGALVGLDDQASATASVIKPMR